MKKITIKKLCMIIAILSILLSYYASSQRLSQMRSLFFEHRKVYRHFQHELSFYPEDDDHKINNKLFYYCKLRNIMIARSNREKMLENKYYRYAMMPWLTAVPDPDDSAELRRLSRFFLEISEFHANAAQVLLDECKLIENNRANIDEKAQIKIDFLKFRAELESNLSRQFKEAAKFPGHPVSSPTQFDDIIRDSARVSGLDPP